MKVVSWNVNGLRAMVKNANFEQVFSLDPDILTLQETKATLEQIPPEARDIPGYSSFFTHPTLKKGYSGVALYTKRAPNKVTFGLGVDHLDLEGRVITAYFNNFAFIGAYFPNGGGAPERFEYKLDFYDAFLAHADSVRAQGVPVIFAGDVNAAHEAIDLARPAENEGTPGYRPEVREWIDEVVRHGYIDTFRHSNPTARTYSYWDVKTRARDRNIGWRIDYVFASAELLQKIKKASIHGDYFGSDHCPVSAEFAVEM